MPLLPLRGYSVSGMYVWNFYLIDEDIHGFKAYSTDSWHYSIAKSLHYPEKERENKRTGWQYLIKPVFMNEWILPTSKHKIECAFLPSEIYIRDVYMNFQGCQTANCYVMLQLWTLLVNPQPCLVAAATRAAAISKREWLWWVAVASLM
jgi:hypothetical protein